MIVVVPSCRNVELAYLAPLVDFGARFIVVDDTDGTIKLNHPQFTVISWGDRKRMLGKLDHAIARRNGASRSLGFLIAWWESDAEETIVALDDDCLIDQKDFGIDVERLLKNGVAWKAIPGGQFTNVLDIYTGLDGARVFPRGFPYSARIDYVPQKFIACDPQPVVFNLGMWSGILDINAVDKVALDSWKVDQPELRVPNAILAPGSLGCLCSMNMQFNRAVVPAIYQFPMHVEVMPGLVIDRYGDIWGGFVLQLLASLRGDSISFGGPTIRHLKEGGFERNLWQEHAAHLVNDEFVEVLSSAVERMSPGSYLEMMRELVELLSGETERRSPILRQYFRHLMPTLGAWVELLSQRHVG